MDNSAIWARIFVIGDERGYSRDESRTRIENICTRYKLDQSDNSDLDHAMSLFVDKEIPIWQEKIEDLADYRRHAIDRCISRKTKAHAVFVRVNKELAFLRKSNFKDMKWIRKIEGEMEKRCRAGMKGFESLMAEIPGACSVKVFGDHI